MNRRLAALTLLAAIAVSCGPRTEDAANAFVAEVVTVEGEATIERAAGGAAEQAVVGTKLAPGDRVRTGDGRVVLRYDSGDVTAITPGSLVEIRAPSAVAR